MGKRLLTQRAWASLVSLTIVQLVSVGRAVAETNAGAAPSENERRTYKLLRDQENWAWLRGEHATRDLWDPLKYVELSREEAIYLTVGGETRQWVEVYKNELWGKGPAPKNVYWLQRYMLHLDAHLTPYARVFIQPKSGLEYGRIGGPRPVDKDIFDFNQAYVDAVMVPSRSPDNEPKLALRIGRQEMSYGSGRFIDVREGPNVRFGYDGARIISRFAPFRVDAFAVRPALTKPGAFDDAANVHQAFWGVWGTIERPMLIGDLYYLGVERDSFAYQRVSGKETRHTIGARARTKQDAVEFELEGAYQFGSVGALPISAWTIAGEALVRGRTLPLAPVLTAGGGVTSGDGGSTSTTLGTFNPLFPRGAYFGLGAANGPENNMSPHVALALALPMGFSLSGEVWAFWRTSLDDGVYNVPGTLLRKGSANQGRYLGTQIQGFVTWRADRHLSLNATLAWFATGSFFETSAPGRDIVYAAAWATYKF